MKNWICKLGILSTIFLLATSAVNCKNFNDRDAREIKKILYADSASNNAKITHIEGPFISGDYAVAYCIYGEMGGQVILQKQKIGQWRMIDGTGGAYPQEYLINELKIPKKDVDSIFR